jgi:hypothetical protein
MPRPRVPSGNNKKYRRWKSVIHNVRADAQVDIDRFWANQTFIKLRTAIEPYSQQDGNHLHIYVEFKNQKYFNSLLNLLKELSKDILDPQADPSLGDIGRVDLKPWSAGETWEQKDKYLTNPVKDKVVGKLETYALCTCDLGCMYTSPFRPQGLYLEPHPRSAACEQYALNLQNLYSEYIVHALPDPSPSTPSPLQATTSDPSSSSDSCPGPIQL